MNGHLSIRLFTVFFTLMLSATIGARAQSPAAAQAANAAYELFQAQNYKEAADAYEKLIKDYPTDLMVGPSQLQLAYSALFLGEYDRSIGVLEQFAKNPATTPELKEVASALLPQVLSSKAASLPTEDAKRKAAFEEAVKKFDEFLKAYPNSPEVENAVYGRALANFQLAKYDEAAKDLESNLKRFASSPTILDSQNLLALTLATQGSIELAKGGTADKSAAFAKYAKAAELLRDIIKKKSDLTLVNAAQFQLGEILFNQASFSTEEERPALLKEALAAYRSVQPNDQLVKLQKERLAAFPQRRREALQRGDTAAIKVLDKAQIRESSKLAELEGRPDQTMQAMLKSGEIFFTDSRLDESRTLFSHLSPHLTDEDQKKRALYFTALTYALQNAVTPAVSSYEQFKEKYKNDELAQNLPLAIGIMYLATPNTAENSPEKAVQYFDESLQMYPKGAFVDQSMVQKATAQTRLEQYAEALKTFQDFLAKNPPAEIGVIAQKGMADIYKDTHRWDEAIAAYKQVVDKFQQFGPQVTESQYWIAVCTSQKGDHAAAIPLLKEFIAKNPDHDLTPNALYVLAAAQVETQAVDDGIATMAELAEKFPESTPAPFTYFMRGQLLSQKGDVPGMVALMKAFLEKYPQDDKVFFAYENLAKTSVASGKPAEAVAYFSEFAEKYPSDPNAASALVQAADLQRGMAESMGRYGALTVDERDPWRAQVDNSVGTLEKVISQYPDSPKLVDALASLMTAQKLLVGAELKSSEQLEEYFQTLAEAQASDAARSKIQFALAGFIAEKEPDRALAKMQEAFNPEVVYSAADLDAYGLGLINKGDLETAGKVFDKIAADYPLPEGVQPAEAPAEIQEAQAIVLFGKGKIAQAQGQTADAAKWFQQLDTLYGWSPKVLDARYGIAESQVKTEPDKALASLTQIIRDPRATAELRANSMLLFGVIYKAKAADSTDTAARDDALKTAIDNFLKIAQFYGGVPSAAAEGLWEGGQLLEQQIATITDAQQKQRQIGIARRGL